MQQLFAWRLARSYSLPTIDLDSLLRGNQELEPRIVEKLCLPPVESRTHDDFTPLMKLARSLKSEIILELGTAYGNTVANLCRQCPSAHIITVNAPGAIQSGDLTTYSLSIDEIGSVYREYGYASRVTQIFQNTLSLDLSNYCKAGSIDLAIIDACHDTNYVINDFQKIHLYLKQQGILLFHDTHPSMKDHLLGSYMACMHLRKMGFDVRHIKGTWWGIWRRQY